MEYYRVGVSLNNWFKSYLSNQQQFVSIDNFNSKTQGMTYGVPEGSVLDFLSI